MTATDYMFICTECASGYFLSDNGYTCTARVASKSNCSVYVNNKDECATCNSGYFLNSTTKFCVPNPTDIYGCALQTTLTACDTCNADNYKDSNN